MKKGMSSVVSTVILVGLVIILIGVVSVVIFNIINSKSEVISSSVDDVLNKSKYTQEVIPDVVENKVSKISTLDFLINSGAFVYFPFNSSANESLITTSYVESMTEIPCSNGKCYFDGKDYVLFNPAVVSIQDNFSVFIVAKPNVSINSFNGANTPYLIFPVHGDKYFSSGFAGVGIALGYDGVGIFEHADNYLPGVLTHSENFADFVYFTLVYFQGSPSLYINGTFLKSVPSSSYKKIFAIKNGKDYTNQYGGIGGSYYGSFKGDLDEIAIWNRSLSAEEVKSLYDYYVSLD